LNPDLDRTRLDVVARRELLAMLGQGPWCWPLEHDSVRRERALAIVPTGPPLIAPGTVPLITVDATFSAASLWVLRLGSHGDEDLVGVSFEADSLQAWEDAATALPRSLPFLWRPVQEARDARHLACHLVTMQLGDRSVGHPTELRGKSFGLGFVLAMASWILGVPVPDDLIATGTVDADGRVGPVEGIREKITVIEQHAPRIRRVLVPAYQAHEAQAATTGGLQIVPVDKAARAVELVFGDALLGFLRRSGADPEARQELVDSFFRLVILGRSAAIDWKPVERGASVALEAWSRLDAMALWKLRFAQAVAARHESNRGEIPLPDDGVLRALPAPVRVLVVVHLLQQCADTGRPSVEVAETLARDQLVLTNEAFAPQLKLWGARARLMAVTGRPEEALRLQEELAQAFLDRLEYEEVSYQLSEWYRLGGALEDQEAFGRAREVHERVVRLGGLGFTGSRYVDLALARARVCLGVTEGPEPEQTLRSLNTDLRIPAHVRWSATRWLARLLDEAGEAESRLSVMSPLVTAADPSRGNDLNVRANLVLVDLDFALARGSEQEAGRATELLKEIDPGPVGHLLTAAHRLGKGGPAYLARFYPY
jgi:hypothetical protein